MRQFSGRAGLTVAGILILTGCAGDGKVARGEVARYAGATATVTDTLLPAVIEAAGTAEPMQQATLSTRLMASVLSVAVHEGDRVSAGQRLVVLDTRDLDARTAQVEAGLAEAEAVERDAEAMARRMRALFADSAATRVQLEQAETGLARAQAAVRTARAGLAEVAALRSYAEIRAPFAGVVARRFVDPGAMAAPGAPLVMIDDLSRLRIRVSATPALVAGIRRGATVDVVVAGARVVGEVEGMVSAGTGNLVQLNLLVPNRSGAVLAGASVTVLLPQGEHPVILLPSAAVVREGDLAGVDLVVDGRLERRWLRLGRELPPGMTEVLSGISPGDVVALPSLPPAGA
jgi:RND family efflux transporter MFP subunit